MSRASIVLIVAITLVVSVTSSLAGMGGDSGDHMGGGGGVRCSLDGINPAHHPEIFGNPAVAASYGFVRSQDGTWDVAPNCQDSCTRRLWGRLMAQRRDR